MQMLCSKGCFCISMENLLKGYTAAAAKQLHWENKMGSLEAGKLANLCILSEDPLKADLQKVKDIQFETVIFEGEVIHGKL